MELNLSNLSLPGYQLRSRKTDTSGVQLYHAKNAVLLHELSTNVSKMKVGHQDGLLVHGALYIKCLQAILHETFFSVYLSPMKLCSWLFLYSFNCIVACYTVDPFALDNLATPSQPLLGCKLIWTADTQWSCRKNAIDMIWQTLKTKQKCHIHKNC